MPLGYKRSVDEALEGRGWENSHLAVALNERYELTGDDRITADQVYEWRRGENEPRAGLTLAVLRELNLLHLSPIKFGFALRKKVGR